VKKQKRKALRSYGRDGGGLVPPVRGGKVQQRVPPLVHLEGS
jgi:hypothetical protein